MSLDIMPRLSLLEEDLDENSFSFALISSHPL